MSDEGAKHWSGTFQRLRAESVVLSLLLLAVARLDVKLEKVPVLGIEFTHALTRGPLLTFLLLFWLYFTAAWWVRYRVERIDANVQINKARNYIDQVKDLTDEQRYKIFEGNARRVYPRLDRLLKARAKPR